MVVPFCVGLLPNSSVTEYYKVLPYALGFLPCLFWCLFNVLFISAMVIDNSYITVILICRPMLKYEKHNHAHALGIIEKKEKYKT